MKNSNQNTEKKEMISKIEKFYNFSSELVAEIGRKYVYVCRNNGAFHKGDMSGVGGWATFCHKTTIEEVYKGLPENWK